jgi:hypothetical protein
MFNFHKINKFTSNDASLGVQNQGFIVQNIIQEVYEQVKSQIGPALGGNLHKTVFHA